ncbi:CLUMA_CG006360, isoform A [Clunio marinus]|uniref:CLUMA_CG006360, isoform A n=1 Tax=Clunio marinus TaxID=568069 RepID=A0A1J1I1Y0_9DIPT|nr:CLUMA_CG006360, isoform A [Clunio marinus]
MQGNEIINKNTIKMLYRKKREKEKKISIPHFPIIIYVLFLLNKHSTEENIIAQKSQTRSFNKERIKSEASKKNERCISIQSVAASKNDLFPRICLLFLGICLVLQCINGASAGQFYSMNSPLDHDVEYSHLHTQMLLSLYKTHKEKTNPKAYCIQK